MAGKCLCFFYTGAAAGHHTTCHVTSQPAFAAGGHRQPCRLSKQWQRFLINSQPLHSHVAFSSTPTTHTMLYTYACSSGCIHHVTFHPPVTQSIHAYIKGCVCKAVLDIKELSQPRHKTADWYENPGAHATFNPIYRYVHMMYIRVHMYT